MTILPDSLENPERFNSFIVFEPASLRVHDQDILCLGEDVFDFDFSFADDIEVKEHTGASSDEKSKLQSLERLVLPLLYNLKKDTSKDYILWDGAKRAAQCEEQITRILEITRG